MDRRDFLERLLWAPALLLPSSCEGGAARGRIRLSFRALGTGVRILLEGRRGVLPAAAGAVREAFRRGDDLLSPFREESALAKLCREAARGSARVGPVLGEFLRASRSAWDATGGAFDPTVGPLVKSFGIHASGRIPSREEFLRARSEVGLEKLEWDPVERILRFPGPGFSLDPCGAGKGLILDLAARAARDAGAESGLLEAGGDLLAFGPRSFLVAIRAAGVRGGVVRLVRLQEGGLAASGLGERVLRAGGRELGHVIDPSTGEPMDPEDRNVPLTAAASAPSGVLADALATGLLVRGAGGLPALEGIPGAGGLLVFRRNGGGFRLEKGGAFPGIRNL